jgi:hypothetical protein
LIKATAVNTAAGDQLDEIRTAFDLLPRCTTSLSRTIHFDAGANDVTAGHLDRSSRTPHARATDKTGLDGISKRDGDSILGPDIPHGGRPRHQRSFRVVCSAQRVRRNI